VKLEKGKVCDKGTILLIIGYVFGSAVIVSPGTIVGQDAWIAQAIGLSIGLIFVWIFAHLLSCFPEKTLIEINETVLGSYFGRALSLLFLWFLFHLGSLTMTDYLDFIKIMIIPLTPAEIVVFLVILPCIYTAKKGIEVIVRCSLILIPFVLIFFLLITVFQINNYEFSNLKPIFTTPLPKLLWAGVMAASFPYVDTVAFLMILPFLNKGEKIKITWLTGLVLGGLIVIISIIRTLLVLGDTLVNYIYPAYYAVRIINIAEILNRFEIFTAMNYLIMGFVRITVLLYAISLGCGQVFKCQSYRPFVIPLGVLMALLSLNNFKHVTQNFEFLKTYPVYALPLELGIPLLVFFAALIRGLPRSVRNK
jgi:spore germination protein KB